MTDETREQDLVGKYFGANRSADDRTMKQACERLRSDAHAEGVKEGRRQAIEEAIIEVEQVAREVVETQRVTRL